MKNTKLSELDIANYYAAKVYPANSKMWEDLVLAAVKGLGVQIHEELLRRKNTFSTRAKKAVRTKMLSARAIKAAKTRKENQNLRLTSTAPVV